ncbi:hypothetical protein Tco_0948603 [Tanacetum coccineum]
MIRHRHPVGAKAERTRMRLFQFSLRDQASNWLERLPAGSITTWEDLYYPLSLPIPIPCSILSTGKDRKTPQ